jgi:hypothetical protein
MKRLITLVSLSTALAIATTSIAHEQLGQRSAAKRPAVAAASDGLRPH